jgi:hypothetical protein
MALYYLIGGTSRSVYDFTPDCLNCRTRIWGSKTTLIRILVFCEADERSDGEISVCLGKKVHKADID